MGLFREGEGKARERFARWAQKVEKSVAKQARRGRIVVDVRRVTPESDDETLQYFHTILGPVPEFGVLVCGKVDGCDLAAILPFRSEAMVFVFDAPSGFSASCENRFGDYNVSGGVCDWVSQPKDRKVARQLNKRLPRPVVQRFTGTAIEHVDRGGHLGPVGGGYTELSLYGLADEKDTINMFADTLGNVTGIVQLLRS